MSTFNLQEMYLTEYNRLIKALQDNFDALKKCTTIEQVVDWLYANAKNNQTISEIDLDSVAFIDIPNAEYSYTQGGRSIKLIKHDNLTAGNIRSGISIEGITGSLVDGSQIIKLTELNSNYGGILGVGNKLGSGIPYYYYDDTNNNISFVTGSAQLRELLDTEKIEGMIYDTVNEKFKFTDTDLNKQVYYKNVSIDVPKSEVTENTDSWTISAGYNPSQYTLERLDEDEKRDLKSKLEYNKTFLGVTGDNTNIINTEVLGADEVNPNQIIFGQKYFRNGQTVIGGLKNLSQSSMTYSSDDRYDTSFIPELSNTHTYTYLRVPGNSYTHNDWYFDISNLKPDNIRNGIKIMGVEGTAAIYNSFPGPYSIQLGAELPNDLETANYNLNDDISFNIDNTVINPKNIRTGIKILGQTGNFTANDGALNYIVYSPTDSTGTDNNDQPITYRETDDIKQGCWAFMDGYLCKGTNVSLKISSYTGDYEISLGRELPLPLPTTNKALYDDIKFKIDDSIVKKEAIAYNSRILGVNGEFTHCTTNPVTPDKIVQDYIAYINGVEISGSSPEYTNEISTTIKGETLPTGFYNGVHIKPLYAEINGNTYAASSAEDRDTIAGFLREGVTLNSGRSGDYINGTGKLIFTANNSTQANDYLNHALHNEIILYTGADDGIFKENNYLEVVTENEIGLVGTAPAFDPLIKARSLWDGDISSDTVLDGKIGYGYRGERVVGTIPVLSAEDQKITIQANDIYWNGNASKTYSRGYYDNGPQVIIDKDTISPNSIKYGEKIFGVEGTYSPNVQAKTITWQRAWGNELTFKASEETPSIDGYKQVTINVNTGTATNIFTENNKQYKIDAEPNTNLIGWTEVNVQIPVDGVLEHTIIPTEVSATNLLTKTFSKTGANADKEAWQTVKMTVPLKDELVITNSGTDDKITNYNTNYFATNYIEGDDQCLGFKKIRLYLIPKLYDLTGIHKIVTNGTFNIADYSSYDGFGNIEVNVTPTLHTRTITWNEIVSKDSIEASKEGVTGWNKINISYTEENVKQHAEEYLSTIELGPSDIGKTIEPSDGLIGFKSVYLDIDTVGLTITKGHIKNGSTIRPTGNNLYDSISFGVTTTNHEITVEEIQNGAVIEAPTDQLIETISFASDVANLIAPEETTATSDQIVFGATAVLNGTLTTGTMAPIAKTYNNCQFLISCCNNVETPNLCVDLYTNKIHTLTANTNFIDSIYLEHWPYIWPDANNVAKNLFIYDTTSKKTSSKTSLNLNVGGTKKRQVKDTIPTAHYFSELGTDAQFNLEDIAITFDSYPDLGVIGYNAKTNQFWYGSSGVILNTGSKVNSSFTGITLKTEYITDQLTAEFVKLFSNSTITITGFSEGGGSIKAIGPGIPPAIDKMSIKTYKGLGNTAQLKYGTETIDIDFNVNTSWTKLFTTQAAVTYKNQFNAELNGQDPCDIEYSVTSGGLSIRATLTLTNSSLVNVTLVKWNALLSDPITILF